MNDAASRERAIEAGARALYGDCQPPWDELPEAMRWADRKDAAAVLAAGAPHLAGEPVGWARVWWSSAGPVLDGAQVSSRPPAPAAGYQVVALVPVDEP